MTARTFVPTQYPLVNVVEETDPSTQEKRMVGLITGPWRRFNETGGASLAPGGINEILTSSGAAFAWQKLKNANVDATAAIAYSKLSLALSIVNGDIAAAAAIAYSKLSLGLSIVNADIALAAAIAWTKVSKVGAVYTDIGGLLAGTYTPTLTGVANVAASTAFACQYLQVGPTVTVSGKLDIDPTAGATLTQIGISLPVASALAAAEQVGGTAVAAVPSYFGAISADAVNDRAQLDFTTAADVANRSWFFSFTYRVI